jgi:CRISPR/Cas system-associated endonuclease Cas1
MPHCPASKKIRRKTFPNCARWRQIVPRPIFAAGLASRLNGAARAVGQFQITGNSFGPRSSPFHLAGNRNAAHPVNAILNYAHAALESKIRIKTISEGYDPTIGTMHEGNDGSSKFVFDLMEPERPKTDRVVLDFVKEHVFDPADFVIRRDGVCRLNSEMARMVVARIST